MKAKYELKDLMNVAIFVVLYYVAFFIGMCFGYIPVLMGVLSLFTGLLSGIPFMLFLTKVKKPGMILLFAAVCGLISLAMGSGVWPLITALIAGLLCELMVRAMKYQPSAKMVLVHAAFSLWSIGFGMRLYLASFDSYRQSLVENYGEEYVAEMLQSVSGMGFWGTMAITLIGGVLGGLLGYAVFKKHFRKISSKA